MLSGCKDTAFIWILIDFWQKTWRFQKNLHIFARMKQMDKEIIISKELRDKIANALFPNGYSVDKKVESDDRLLFYVGFSPLYGESDGCVLQFYVADNELEFIVLDNAADYSCEDTVGGWISGILYMVDPRLKLHETTVRSEDYKRVSFTFGY